MRRRRSWVLLLGVVVLVAAVWVVRTRLSVPQDSPGAQAARTVVPVVAATVARRDVPIHLEGR